MLLEPSESVKLNDGKQAADDDNGHGAHDGADGICNHHRKEEGEGGNGEHGVEGEEVGQGEACQGQVPGQ